MSVPETVSLWCNETGVRPPDHETWSRLLAFRDELLAWNRRVNLTADRDPDTVLYRHILDSITPLTVLPDGLDGLLDIGSGGGFPAIPLAICRPALAVVMVERVARKCAWLRAVSRKLGLDHVQVVEGDLTAVQLRQVPDWAITRAVRVDRAFCRRLAEMGVSRLVTFETTAGGDRALQYRLPGENRDRWLSVRTLQVSHGERGGCYG